MKIKVFKFEVDGTIYKYVYKSFIWNKVEKVPEIFRLDQKL